jgi:DNA-binding NarL/FixJ family response regulator
MSPRALRRGASLRLVVADESFLARAAVSSMLEDVAGFAVVDVVGDYESLMAAVERTAPDVIVSDIRMPPTWTDEGIRAAGELRVTHPQMGVVILSEDVQPAYVLDLLRLGSAGRAYLLKERLQNRKELVDAVRAVARAGSVIDPRVVELLVTSRTTPNDSRLAQLSPREMEIMREIATGKGNAAIARTFRLSKRSVEKHIHSIFTKLELAESDEISRRVTAVLIFLDDHAGQAQAREGADPSHR